MSTHIDPKREGRFPFGAIKLRTVMLERSCWTEVNMDEAQRVISSKETLANDKERWNRLAKS